MPKEEMPNQVDSPRGSLELRWPEVQLRLGG